MRPVEKTSDLRLVVKDFERKGEHFGDARQTVTLLGRQGLLFLAATFQGRLGYDTIGKAAGIVWGHTARELVQRRNRQALLHGIGQRERRLAILRFDTEKVCEDCTLVAHEKFCLS